jgi:hypothetical protein
MTISAANQRLAAHPIPMINRNSGVLMTMRKCKLAILAIAFLLQVHIGASYLFAQVPKAEAVTRQETLRGSVTPEREWWDVLHYHLQVEFLPETRRLRGSNTITFKTLKPGNKMQIDLQPPLVITKITHGASQLKFEREGNVYWVMFEKDIPKGAEDKIEIFYEGGEEMTWERLSVVESLMLPRFMQILRTSIDLENPITLLRQAPPHRCAASL